MSYDISSNTRHDAFAHIVRARRRHLRLRQDELADLAGVSERFIYALENGKRSVHMDKVVAVLAALGLHLEVHRGPDQEIKSNADLAAP
jgi:HTH-type transcriptional regulator/antitoxin HipB